MGFTQLGRIFNTHEMVCDTPRKTERSSCTLEIINSQVVDVDSICLSREICFNVLESSSKISKRLGNSWFYVLGRTDLCESW